MSEVVIDSGDFDLQFVNSAGVPAFISSIPANSGLNIQVRALAGTFAPPAGKRTIQNVAATISPNWLAQYGCQISGGSYSGGDKNSDGRPICTFTGGGHGDSPWNALIECDFGGSGNTPNGMTLRSGANTFPPVNDTDPQPDGTPGAAHSIDALCSIDGKFYRASYAIFPNIGGGHSWVWDPTVAGASRTAGWTQLPARPASIGEYNAAVGDPVSKKMLCMVVFGQQNYCFYRSVADGQGHAANTFSTAQSHPGLGFTAGCNMLRPTPGSPHLGTILDTGGLSMTVNWNTETLSNPVQRAGLMGGAAGGIYDALTDSFWIFAGGNTSPYTQIQRVNATTFAVTNYTFVGDAMVQSDVGYPYNGTYGRHVWIPQWRTVGLVLGRNDPPYVFRLPSS